MLEIAPAAQTGNCISISLVGRTLRVAMPSWRRWSRGASSGSVIR